MKHFTATLATFVLFCTVGSSANSQDYQQVTELKLRTTVDGPHLLIATMPRETEPRLGVDFTCKPEPVITFHMGSYPDTLSPILVYLDDVPLLETFASGQKPDFYKPEVKGREGIEIAKAVLKAGQTVHNGYGIGFTLTEAMKDDLMEVRKQLSCLGR